MIALQNNTTKSISLESLKKFIVNRHLARHNFRELDELLATVAYEYRRGRISKEDIAEINISFGEEFLKNTLHGRGFLKPNGYSGDYLFLDKVYTNHISKNPKYYIWDEYVHQNGAPNAVRYRKEYFKYVMRTKVKGCSELNILNVVSGSGRELLELYDSLSPDKKIISRCVEIDKQAIAFSKELNKNYLKNITYEHTNIFKYKNVHEHDIIWSAGLFDYLNDSAFVVLLNRFREWLKKEGEIIIGNFNENHNPSRDYMEILGDWHLIHRTEERLLKLAKQAGFGEHEIHVSRMPDNVILYLHLRSEQTFE